MKNVNIYLFLILTVLIFPVVGLSQPLTLSWEGETIDDSLVVVGFTTDNELVAHVIVTNNTANSMGIKVKRTSLETVGGSVNYFCWAGNCYPPSVNQSPGYLTLSAGQSSGDEDFSGHYVPNGNYGDSFIEYEFFNMDNESENVKVVVQFAATIVSIDEHDLDVNIYPNPATEYVTIKLSCKMSTVMVYDYTGTKVMEENVNSSSHKMNTSLLSPGIYLFKILTEKGVNVKQIIIK